MVIIGEIKGISVEDYGNDSHKITLSVQYRGLADLNYFIYTLSVMM